MQPSMASKFLRAFGKFRLFIRKQEMKTWWECNLDGELRGLPENFDCHAWRGEAPSQGGQSNADPNGCGAPHANQGLRLANS